MPESVRVRMRARWTQIRTHPFRLTVAGIIVSVLVIQVVMRKCFSTAICCSRCVLPADSVWLAHLMLNDGRMSLFFAGLVAATVTPAAVAFGLSGGPDEGRSLKLLRALLIFRCRAGLALACELRRADRGQVARAREPGRG